jgi:hypothetical protein
VNWSSSLLPSYTVKNSEQKHAPMPNQRQNCQNVSEEKYSTGFGLGRDRYS